ncbi:MAG: hypothetical protein PHN44_04195, partial [Candidatus Marinimicrobia bacterium]|nr:hypothetical protein [Candidatus Neomarinimicrobiota bacterium]MDD5539513.1 hypothetical protein [Candidatus Neomarinimicrobiota bacterium]
SQSRCAMKQCPECQKRKLRCIDSRQEHLLNGDGLAMTTIRRAYVCGHCGRFFESRETIKYYKDYSIRRRRNGRARIAG